MNYVAELIIWLAGHSQLLAHQLLWNMQTNMFTDEESKIQDTIMYSPLKAIVERVNILFLKLVYSHFLDRISS
jgi:phosphatidylinositol 4-kinase